MRTEFRFAGSGGQGLVWLANAVAVAAVHHAGMHATQSASYGAATRGGYSSGDVVIGEEPIDYPWLMAPDVLVAMDREAYSHDVPLLRPDGLLLVEAGMVERPSGPRHNSYRVPAMEVAERVAGARLAAGCVMLGVLDVMCERLPAGALEAAIESRSPARAREGNLAAYRAGVEQGQRLSVPSS